MVVSAKRLPHDIPHMILPGRIPRKLRATVNLNEPTKTASLSFPFSFFFYSQAALHCCSV